MARHRVESGQPCDCGSSGRDAGRSGGPRAGRRGKVPAWGVTAFEVRRSTGGSVRRRSRGCKHAGTCRSSRVRSWWRSSSRANGSGDRSGASICVLVGLARSGFAILRQDRALRSAKRSAPVSTTVKTVSGGDTSSSAEDALANLRERLARTQLPHPTPGEPWSAGMDCGYLAELGRYWREEFDWRASSRS
ncbi:epoxide hydrolase N-terminal domain-containing protein [Catenulispora sp. GP43]|uniref:epoxide hydrolase N-terminal domain-containing protein n=1 Tax=Catenulispora sp. GP43 TaxID=3156263 RepID=UPI0035121A5F